jgi:transketolase
MLKPLCAQIRRRVVEMFLAADGGHLPAALSLVEILVTLFCFTMNRAESGFSAGERDRFILSKGHGCLALYAVLAHLGLITEAECADVGRPGSRLGWHPSRGQVPGIEVSSGSLGMGAPVAVGLAMNARLKGLPYRTFCVLGDGECNEGVVWEAALSAAHKRLERLFFLVDVNGQQANGETNAVCDLRPFRDKWTSFGFSTFEADLRADPCALLNLFNSGALNSDRPKAILCLTSKGAGVPLVEGDPSWHSRSRLSDADRARLRTAMGFSLPPGKAPL